MHPSSDPENFYLWKCFNDFRLIYCQPLCLSGAIKTRKNKNPCSKGFYIHSAEMNQGYFIFIGKDWPIGPFSPVALHVHRVFPIVFVVFTKELQNCAVVQPDQSGIMLLGSKRIRHQTGCTVFINITGIIGCWAMCLFGCGVSYVYS